METKFRPEMIAIAGFTGIALGAMVLSVVVTFGTSPLFPVLVAGIAAVLLLIALDYRQWIRHET